MDSVHRRVMRSLPTTDRGTGRTPVVMAGLDPPIYRGTGAGIDGRIKPGHDDGGGAGNLL